MFVFFRLKFSKKVEDEDESGCFSVVSIIIVGNLQTFGMNWG